MNFTDYGCVFVNGVYGRPSEARVSPLDHGFLYGDGLFESLRTYGGRPFRLSKHLERLTNGLDLLGFERRPSSVVIREVLAETFRRSGLDESYLRVTVTRGISLRGLDPTGAAEPTWVVASLPLRTYPAEIYQRGARVVSLWSRAEGGEPPRGVKTTSYQGAVLARKTLRERSADEGVYLCEDGSVAEGTVSNLFAVRGGRLYTPPSSCCLPGVTRAEVLEIAATAGLEVREERDPLDSWIRSEEMFFTNSLAELVPVVQLDGRSIGSGKPGPIHERLHRLYRERTASTFHEREWGT